MGNLLAFDIALVAQNHMHVQFLNSKYGINKLKPRERAIY